MALADIDPINRARMERRDQMHADLCSVDPVARYRAREAYISENIASATNALIRHAKDAEREFQRQQESYDRMEKSGGKYRAINPHAIKNLSSKGEK